MNDTMNYPSPVWKSRMASGLMKNGESTSNRDIPDVRGAGALRLTAKRYGGERRFEGNRICWQFSKRTNLRARRRRNGERPAVMLFCFENDGRRSSGESWHGWFSQLRWFLAGRSESFLTNTVE